MDFGALGAVALPSGAVLPTGRNWGERYHPGRLALPRMVFFEAETLLRRWNVRICAPKLYVGNAALVKAVIGGDFRVFFAVVDALFYYSDLLFGQFTKRCHCRSTTALVLRRIDQLVSHSGLRSWRERFPSSYSSLLAALAAADSYDLILPGSGSCFAWLEDFRHYWTFLADLRIRPFGAINHLRTGA